MYCIYQNINELQSNLEKKKIISDVVFDN